MAAKYLILHIFQNLLSLNFPVLLYLGYFQFFPITNDATINIFEYKPLLSILGIFP